MPLNAFPRFFIVSLLLAPSAAVVAADPVGKPPAAWIDPLIGTNASRAHGNLGKTFPGPCRPFGMVQLSPDTDTTGDQTAGYSHHNTTIEGFSFTHMSGVGWHGDFGNLLVTPARGPLHVVPGREEVSGSGYRSRFRHETEVVQAGYYAVTLEDHDIRSELTATARAGMLRFSFPGEGDETNRVQFDLAHRIGGTSTRQFIRVVDDRTFEGWIACDPSGGGWGHGGGRVSYKLHFHGRFSAPFRDSVIWSADLTGVNRKESFSNQEAYRERIRTTATLLRGRQEHEGDHLGFNAEFAHRDTRRVLLKVGISFVDIEGARRNLDTELDHWDFERVRREAWESWNRALGESGLTVEGGTDDQRTIFHTALYHTMIDPRCVSDADGRYVGADRRVHVASGFTYRSIFSGWDVFRSQFPLQTLINPRLVDDEINTLMQIAELSGRGYFPQWEHMGAYSPIMLGDPALAVIADAYRKGIRGFDAEKAFALCRETSLRGWRPQADFYNERGYVPGSISWTLESAYFDACLARFAGQLGREEDARFFGQRALNYRHLFDPEVGFMRARDRDGAWLPWKGPTVFGQGCAESNPYQQGWFVPHDPQGLVALMGRDEFERKLTAFFELTPRDLSYRNPYFSVENEIVHTVPYLFTSIGQPWQTQKWLRFALANAFRPGVYGLPGNDDVGQMSAWYVLNAIGLHPLDPAGGVLIIGSPIFDRITLALDRRYYAGERFSITVRNNGLENIYIQSARLNGRPIERAWLHVEEVTRGGELELVMGREPNRDWGADPRNFPPSWGRP
ncbi:MAG: hypothetical protein RIR76_2433 [Verrucomicrobiota bacterium]